MSTDATPRRGFLSRSLVAAAGMLAVPSLSAASSSRAQSAPDESWLQGLTGKHRQYFDVTLADARALGRVGNFLDAYAEAYGMKDSELNAVFGAHGPAVPLMLNDTLWTKYGLGTRNNIVDPATRAPATRNVFATGAVSVARLQERGVRFIVCMRSIRRLSGELATAGNSADQVRAEILTNLLPGVTAVPAAIVATNRAQESGLTYAYIG